MNFAPGTKVNNMVIVSRESNKKTGYYLMTIENLERRSSEGFVKVDTVVSKGKKYTCLYNGHKCYNVTTKTKNVYVIYSDMSARIHA